MEPNLINNSNGEPKFIQVDVRFLQALVEYMRKRPYEEVFMFLDALVGKNQQLAPQQAAQQQAPVYQTQPNISEFVPEGFTDVTNNTQG
jgi:hypothetical protein